MSAESQNFYIDKTRTDILSQLSEIDDKKSTEVLRDAIDMYASFRGLNGRGPNHATDRGRLLRVVAAWEGTTPQEIILRVTGGAIDTYLIEKLGEVSESIKEYPQGHSGTPESI